MTITHTNIIQDRLSKKRTPRPESTGIAAGTPVESGTFLPHGTKDPMNLNQTAERIL